MGMTCMCLIDVFSARVCTKHDISLNVSLDSVLRQKTIQKSAFVPIQLIHSIPSSSCVPDADFRLTVGSLTRF